MAETLETGGWADGRNEEGRLERRDR